MYAVRSMLVAGASACTTTLYFRRDFYFPNLCQPKYSLHPQKTTKTFELLLLHTGKTAATFQTKQRKRKKEFKFIIIVTPSYRILYDTWEI